MTTTYVTNGVEITAVIHPHTARDLGAEHALGVGLLTIEDNAIANGHLIEDWVDWRIEWVENQQPEDEQ
jgi:hypothetical protein